MKMLLTDDCNYHEAINPRAYLIEVDRELTKDEIYRSNHKQLGVGHVGTHIDELVENLRRDYNMEVSILQEGRRSDFPEYKENRVISGNY